jgi:hypothetical protein
MLHSKAATDYYNLLRERQGMYTEGEPGTEFKMHEPAMDDGYSAVSFTPPPLTTNGPGAQMKAANQPVDNHTNTIPSQEDGN